MERIEESHDTVATQDAKTDHCRPVGRYLPERDLPVFTTERETEPHTATYEKEINKQITPEKNWLEAECKPQFVQISVHKLYKTFLKSTVFPSPFDKPVLSTVEGLRVNGKFAAPIKEPFVLSLVEARNLLTPAAPVGPPAYS